MKRLSLACFSLALFLMIPLSAFAEETKPMPFEKEVAIIILDVQGGTGLAKSELPNLYQEIFDKKGFTVVMGEPVEEAAKKLGIKLDNQIRADDLVRLGRELSVKNIIPVKTKVSTDRVWVNLLPRARSIVELNTMIITTTADERFMNVEVINQSSYARGGGLHQEALAMTIAFPRSQWR